MTQETKKEEFKIITQRPDMGLWFDPVGYQYIRAYNVNSGIKHEVGPEEYDCPTCFNRGYVMGIKNDKATVDDCECKAIRKNWDAIKKSGMKELMEQHSFENYIVGEPWQRILRDAVRKFGEDPKGWLLLCGQTGGGKTHLASALCRSLAARYMEIKYMSWVEAAPALKALSMDAEPRENRMDTYKRAQVLFIDDLFKCGNMNRREVRVTDADLRLAHELLEYRNVHKKVTIVTSELDPDRMRELDPALFGRMVENCKGNIFTIPYGDSRNYRLHKGA